MLELNAIQPRGAKTVVRDTPPKIDPLKPIHRATMNNDVAAFCAEVAAGVDINLPGPEDMTPLHIAADRGNIEIAKELLDEGAHGPEGSSLVELVQWRCL
ncbi:ankyrin repeat domain-containing protein [Mycobacteroides abscessus]|uniref:ankyrin repeat domain-containing protein n=1 Tax=Mycobacteroides abscessus TaxID=36809 RepID=UPI00210358A6|nr:ankyrin repeat domain-containing protein [Mycobacteroides abscessus]